MNYGRLTVIGNAPDVGDRPALRCQCECGNSVDVQRKKLLSGHTQSCGCLQKQRSRENLKMGHDINRTHGASHTKEWQAWVGMRSRVNYDHPVSGKYYRDKGISVAPEWENDFPAFLAHIGPAPKGKYSVDRIEGDQGYVPGNVRWATDRIQNRNKSDNVVISWQGQDRLLIEVIEELGLPYQTISYRIQRAGWPVDRALTQPIARTGRWNRDAALTACNPPKG